MSKNERNVLRDNAAEKRRKVLDRIDALKKEQIKNRMLIAAKIDDGLRAKGWNQKTFAMQMKKSQSEINKWLSGTNNFTTDVLTEIGLKLGINFFSLNSDLDGQLEKKNNCALNHRTIT
jgi:ribosome-binding protein aMBF1 (putative translation factor)